MYGRRPAGVVGNCCQRVCQRPKRAAAHTMCVALRRTCFGAARRIVKATRSTSTNFLARLGTDTASLKARDRAESLWLRPVESLVHSIETPPPAFEQPHFAPSVSPL